MRRLQRSFGLPVAPAEPTRATPGALAAESHVDSTPSTQDVDVLIAEDELAGLDDPDVKPQDSGPFLKD